MEDCGGPAPLLERAPCHGPFGPPVERPGNSGHYRRSYRQTTGHYKAGCPGLGENGPDGGVYREAPAPGVLSPAITWRIGGFDVITQHAFCLKGSR